MENYSINSTVELYESVFTNYLKAIKRQKDYFPAYNANSDLLELFDLSDREQHTYTFFLGTYNKNNHEYIANILKSLHKFYEIDVNWLFDSDSLLKYSQGCVTDFVVRRDDKLYGYVLSCPELEKIHDDINALGLTEITVVLLHDKTIGMNKNSYKLYGVLEQDHIKVIYLEDYFAQVFDNDEFAIFEKCLREFKNQAKNVIGFKTSPYLSNENLASFKANVVRALRTNDLSFMYYRHVGDSKTEDVMPDYNSQDLQLINQQFLNEEMYKGLIGKADFAQSFLTSEWLYYTLKGTKNFEFTSIVCGYIKSIEQLLHLIIMCFQNRKHNNKYYWFTLDKNRKSAYLKTGREILKDYGSFYSIPLVSDNQEYFDTSLAS